MDYTISPEKKANELGNKFYYGSVFDHNKEEHIAELHKAKERALICVEEILNTIQGSSPNETWNYWLDVKLNVLKLI